MFECLLRATGVVAFSMAGVIPLQAVAATNGGSCADFTNAATQLQNIASAKGYGTLARPVNPQALADFQKFVNQEKVLLTQYSNLGVNCPAYGNAQQAYLASQVLLAELQIPDDPGSQVTTAFSSSPAAVTNYIEVNLPCKQNASDPPVGLRLCSDVIRDATKSVDTQLKTWADAFYSGCDLNPQDGFGPGGSVATPTTCKKNQPFPVCNVSAGVTGIANTAPETTSNHLGASCGSLTRFSTQVQGRSCIIGNPNQAFGSKEHAFLNGARVRAVDCHWAQVKSELAQGKIRLTAPAGVDPRQLYKTLVADFDSDKSYLLAQPNIQDIDNCQILQANPSNPQDPMQNRSSACFLVSLRSLLEGKYMHLAALEVFNRAQRSYERFEAGSTPTEDFWQQLSDYLNANKNSCTGHSGDCNPSRYTTGCYQPLLLKLLTTRADTVWMGDVCSR